MSNSMNLNLPTVSVTPGPAWATQVNVALTAVAEHNHSSGNGVKITPAGINIISELVFNNNNATGLRSARLQSQGAVINLVADLGCLTNVNGDLYWVNQAGTPVQITTGGAINIASVGTIGGDYGQSGVTASVAYSNTTKTFTFLQGSGQAARMFTGTLNIANEGTGALSVSLGASASTASYALTLPIAAPAADTVLSFDTAGQATFRTISGTAGEVTVSPSATAHTVSLPSTITKALTFSGANTYSGTAAFTGTETHSGAATFSNAVAFTGSTSGRGILPLGAVIATMPHLVGAYSCSATTVADANGFVQCAGQTISDATSPMNGTVIPNINDDAFLRGNATSGSAAGSNANITLSTANVPSHTHTIDHGHSASSADAGNHAHTIGHGHSNNFGLTGTTTFAADGHTHGRGSFVAQVASGGGSTGTNMRTESTTAYTATTRRGGADLGGSESTSQGAIVAGTSATNSSSAAVGFTGAVTDMSGNSGSTGTHSHSITVVSHSGDSGTGSGSATSFSVLPKFISARFIIRIK